MLNSSPKYWENPEKFEPERFIEENRIKKPSHFIPFSTGKRSCIGSKIFLNVVFVTVATILQKYVITSPEGQKIHLPRNKICIEMDGFDLLLTPRN